MTLKELEAEAVRAHQAGESWSAFWTRVSEHARLIEPVNLPRFRRLTDRLLSLVVSGDLDGMTAVGDDELWATDDAADQPEPDDTATAATIQTTLWDTSEPYV